MARAAGGHPGSKRTKLCLRYAFYATRLRNHPGLSCGAIDAKIDVDALISRAMPHKRKSRPAPTRLRRPDAEGVAAEGREHKEESER